MTSSPYQSNLLRFLVRQYRQGVNRHRLAVRKTRSAVVLGSEVGVAIAITPAYALIRAAQNIGKKAVKTLEQTVDKLHLPAVHSKPSELTDLLDLSGFTRLPTIKGDKESAGIELSECEVDDSAQAKSEVLMAKVLVATGESLLPTQRKLLGQLSWWQSFTAKTKRLAKRLTVISRSHRSTSLSCEREASEEVMPTESRKITALASDISTQSLVLVLGNLTIWDGLSANQKRQIQSKIDFLLGTSRSLQQATSVRRSLPFPSSALEVWRTKASKGLAQTSQGLAVLKNDLVRPMQSFWVAVLHMMSSWFQRREAVSYSQSLMGDCLKLPVLSALLQRSVDGDARHLTFVHSATALTSETTLASVLCTSATQSAALRPTSDWKSRNTSYLDATVISVDYVEHPLEKLLKWVDRLFLWIESWWQRLLDWQQRHKASG